jgi:superfamily II DNA or RNA helicase
MNSTKMIETARRLEQVKASLKSHYRSGRDDLASDFFGPSLAVSTMYRRISGYFSSAALLTWTDGLMRLGSNHEFEIRLIASPELSERDRATLATLVREDERSRYREVMVEAILADIISLAASPGDHARRARVFAWLIANDRLKLKFAFPNHVEEAGIFHEKLGIFDFDDGSQVAFTGSANETARGHRRNYESIDVYRGWSVAEAERVATKIEQFEETWNNVAVGLEVLEPGLETIDRLNGIARKVVPARETIAEPKDERWRHQDEAIATFLASRAGVLEMATGTGKTRTAIRILNRLIDEGTIDTAIVTTDGTDLLDQWAGELETWAHDRGDGWLVLRQYESNRQAAEYGLAPKRALIVVSRGQLPRVFTFLNTPIKQKALIIHDEVHGLGVPGLVAELQGEHLDFGWRLGLSATPERAYDDAGNAFIASEVGPTIYEFPLERAIARGVLAEFDYLPLPYDLTQNDRDRFQAIYARKAARLREGNPMSNEEIWTEIAKVYKTAEMKPAVYREYLASNPESLQRAIIFVETKDYGEQILHIIDDYTNRYRTYYAEDDRQQLVEFAQGSIDCLITCHRISQGIDIQSLNTVVLFASARSRLETVQRIGRCLRSDPTRPDKRALVIDFVRPPVEGETLPNADQDRAAWLMELSKVRKGDEDGPRQSA